MRGGICMRRPRLQRRTMMWESLLHLSLVPPSLLLLRLLFPLLCNPWAARSACLGLTALL